MRALSLVQQAGYTLLSIARGMGVTLVNLFRKKQTVQYPSEQLVLPPGFRGHLNFIEEKCIVCELCEKACPVPGSRTEWTIELFHHIGPTKKRELDEFYIDYSTCINCYLCVEVCPTDALLPGSSFELGRGLDELAMYDRSRMIFGKDQLRQMPQSEEHGTWETAHDHVKAGTLRPKPDAGEQA
jgi:NADH-quinone oxidoreductase subunit I